MKYKAIKIGGYGYCESNDIKYIIDNVGKWCGPFFDLYVDGVKVDDPIQYLENHRPHSLENIIVDMHHTIFRLQEENKQLREWLEKYRKGE